MTLILSTLSRLTFNFLSALRIKPTTVFAPRLALSFFLLLNTLTLETLPFLLSLPRCVALALFVELTVLLTLAPISVFLFLALSFGLNRFLPFSLSSLPVLPLLRSKSDDGVEMISFLPWTAPWSCVVTLRIVRG